MVIQVEGATYNAADLSQNIQEMKKHEFSLLHLNASIKLHLLWSMDIRLQLNGDFRYNDKKHNGEVIKNHYVLSTVIDCILFCSAFEKIIQ